MKTILLFSICLMALVPTLSAQHKPYFLEPMAGFWIPQKNYRPNHQTSFQAGLEGGKRIVQLADGQFVAALLGGILYSPQKLRPHLIEERSAMLQAYLGARGEFFPSEKTNVSLTLGAGLINESDVAEPGHAPPSWKGYTVLGIGAGKWLNETIRVGLRLDWVSSKSGGEKRVGWVNGLVFAGFNF